MTAHDSRPTTMQGWWDFIQSDATFDKIDYFLRNNSAIRSSCVVQDGSTEMGTRWTSVYEFFRFLEQYAEVNCHRDTYYVVREKPGSAPRFEFQVRIDHETYSQQQRRMVPCTTLNVMNRITEANMPAA